MRLSGSIILAGPKQSWETDSFVVCGRQCKPERIREEINLKKISFCLGKRKNNHRITTNPLRHQLRLLALHLMVWNTQDLARLGFLSSGNPRSCRKREKCKRRLWKFDNGSAFLRPNRSFKIITAPFTARR